MNTRVSLKNIVMGVLVGIILATTIGTAIGEKAAYSAAMAIDRWFAVGTDTRSGKVTIKGNVVGEKTLIVKGAASQTADLIEAQTSAGVDVFSVSPAGAISWASTLTGKNATFDGMSVADHTRFAKTVTTVGVLTASGGVVGNLTGNADTATALAANGANCAANTFPLGVSTTGASESCTMPSVFDGGTFGDHVRMAKTLTVVGVLTATGGVSGSATSLAANGANCSANTYPLGVDASGAVESCSQPSVFDGATFGDTVSHARKTTFTEGVVPATKTSDPCTGTAAFPEGAIFYNSTGSIMCYCNKDRQDLKIDGSSAACF